MTACQVRDEIARACLYSLSAIVAFVIVLRELERRTD